MSYVFRDLKDKGDVENHPKYLKESFRVAILKNILIKILEKHIYFLCTGLLCGIKPVHLDVKN